MITPPPELVQQWIKESDNPEEPRWQEYEQDIATQAAQWGADQELEACCQWLEQNCGRWELPTALRAARRPEPQTLNSVALQMLGTIERDAHYIPEITDTIRKALKALPND